jgi:hypothetical protein
MAVTLQSTSFDNNGNPKHLMSKDGSLSIDGIGCTVSEFEMRASKQSITAYKAVIKADERQENITLCAYIKNDLQRLQSIFIAGSNPFTITSGDYIFRCLRAVLSCGEKCFNIEIEGAFFINLNNDTMRE